MVPALQCLKSHPSDAKHHAPHPSASTILHRPHRNHYYLRTIFNLLMSVEPSQSGGGAKAQWNDKER